VPSLHPACEPPLHAFRVQTRDYNIKYQLVRDGASFLCRRERRRGSTFGETVELPLFDLTALTIFLDADHDLHFARNQRQQLVESARTVVNERPPSVKPSLDPSDLVRCAASVGAARDLADAHRLLRDAAWSVGLDGYTALLGDWGANHRIEVCWLAGTYPAWSQYVLRRDWYLNSGLLQHARESDQVTYGAEVFPRTDGQREILRTARTFGIRSRVVIPRIFVASGARWDFGALILYGQAEPAIGEAASRLHSTLLRGIATTFIDRWAALIERRRASEVALTDIECRLLEFVREGIEATEAAMQLNLSTACVNNHYRRINEKFGVHDKLDALAMAAAHGLLSASPPGGRGE